MTDQRTPEEPRERKMRSVVLACTAGTALEMYDFMIYGLSAALVLGPLFFPSTDGTASTLGAFATFAVGFFARPMGAILFGHLGDRVGRKQVLQLTLVLMGAATALIGLLPTHDQVGLLAPVLLIVIRLLQGAALGGEQGGAWLTVIEHAPPERRGYYGAWVIVGTSLGAILGSLVMLSMTTLLGVESFAAWGWRIPFILGIVLVFAGIFTRLKLSETPTFKTIAANNETVRLPILVVLKSSWRTVLLIAGIAAASTTSGYLTTVYSVSLLGNFHVHQGVAIAAPLAYLIVAAPTVLVGGWLSDKFGRERIMRIGMVSLVVYGVPFFWMLSTGNTLVILIAMILMALGPSMTISGPMGAYFAERFAGNVRMSGLSLGYQFGSIFGGGLAPFLATLMYTASGKSLWGPALYLSVAGVVGLGCLTILSSRKLELPDSSTDRKRGTTV